MRDAPARAKIAATVPDLPRSTRTSPPPWSGERPRGSLTAGHFHPATVAGRAATATYHGGFVRCYVISEQRLVERFACNSAGFSACRTLPSKDPPLP
jgi:hypothetical protein